MNRPSSGNQKAASPRPAVGRAPSVNTAEVNSSLSSASCHGSRVGASSGSRIGVVVITSADYQMLGILSERDLVRTLARNARVAGGCQFCGEPVRQVMTRQVETPGF